MATHITHIALAEAALRADLQPASQKDFLIGTLFPDIRYLTDIDRERTHVWPLNWADIQAEPNSFRAGLKFHNLVDQTREAFLLSQGIDRVFPDYTHKIMTAIKFYEDQLLYGQVADWPGIIAYFAYTLPEEAEFGIETATVWAWHQTLQTYFQAPPSNESRRRHLLDLGFELDSIEEINGLVGDIAQKPEVKKYVEYLRDNFLPLIKNYVA